MKTREWVSPKGIRCAEVDEPGLEGQTMVDMRDLAKFLASLDASSCRNPAARDALLRFQRDVTVLAPAAAHRAAVKLLESLGAELGPDFHRPLVHAVKGGAE